MTTLHLLDPGFATAEALIDLLARRRITVTRGPAEAGRGAAVLVAATADAAAERDAQFAARAAGIRALVMLRENAPAFAVEAEQGGRVLRISLPACPPTAGGHAPGLLMPAMLMLADILAAPLRPMVACDTATGALIDLATRVARTEVTVFINGPTGSGKEVLARAVHAASRRAGKPFVAINCAAIPENMLEAMLFGHEKGSFTGAATANRGLIRAADGGTLLLDEVSEMPLALQSKLLRVIQERQVTPLGSSTEVAVDIRIIATSNRDMAAEVRAGRFREDLYYRLHVFPLTTRALAQRADDIPALALSLLRRHWTMGTPPLFTPAAIDALRSHSWPGNVRELDNVVQRALVLCNGTVIDLADIVLDSAAGLIFPAEMSTAMTPPMRLAEAV
jgi:two-component system response regulator FlrC